MGFTDDAYDLFKRMRMNAWAPLNRACAYKDLDVFKQVLIHFIQTDQGAKDGYTLEMNGEKSDLNSHTMFRKIPYYRATLPDGTTPLNK